MARARYLKEEYIVNTLRKSVSIYLTCTRKGIKKREIPSRMTAIFACKRTHTHTKCSSQTLLSSFSHAVCYFLLLSKIISITLLNEKIHSGINIILWKPKVQIYCYTYRHTQTCFNSVIDNFTSQDEAISPLQKP